MLEYLVFRDLNMEVNGGYFLLSDYLVRVEEIY